MRKADVKSVWFAFKLTCFSDVASGACLLWQSQETCMRQERQAPLGLPAWGRCFECSPSGLFFVWGWGVEVRSAWYNLINLFLTPQYTGRQMLPVLAFSMSKESFRMLRSHCVRGRSPSLRGQSSQDLAWKTDLVVRLSGSDCSGPYYCCSWTFMVCTLIFQIIFWALTMFRVCGRHWGS